MIKGDPLSWLLEKDEENPSVRYLALRDLVGLPESNGEVRAARAALMESGPVPVILDAQSPEGFWVKAGVGYSPKYRATVWSLLILAEMGADPDEPRVRAGCEYLLDHSRASDGAFSVYQDARPSGALLCLNGNLLFALQRLGFGGDPRVQTAVDWTARAIVGDEPVVYYASGTSGPDFACGVNLGQGCGWGANKAIRGLLAVAENGRTPLIDRALAAGAAFLLSRDPAAADYPYTERVNASWFKLGFPLSYWSDVLETVSNLVELGYGGDPRLEGALAWIFGKQDDQGRWKLENSLKGKMWVDIETRGKPSKWITLRVLTALKRAGLYAPVG